MVERPLLKLHKPEKVAPASNPGHPQENVLPPDIAKQGQRLGPKFERLSRVLPDPSQLAELRNDPAAIAPERALVFEIASEFVDFYRACRNISGLEFLGEDQDEMQPDEDFVVKDKPNKAIHRRIYFTMPDATALREIVSLWKKYLEGIEFDRGKTVWKKIFGYLSDIRPWGPQDRITEEAKESWRQRLKSHPNDPIRFEVEYWFRTDIAQRRRAHQRLSTLIDEFDGQIHDQVTIPEIRYDATLLEVLPEYIQQILDNPDIGLAAFDEIMVLRPQSIVTDAQDVELEDLEDTQQIIQDTPSQPPLAALLDGLPMAQHQKLVNRLNIDDPDDCEERYGQASEQIHGTSMASLIIHGDLNVTDPESPIRSQLYIRPVMYPQNAGFDELRESMPPDRLTLDLIWRSFIRMFEGEGGEEATAPSVKIINMSLGDLNRRFYGVLSPWAKLVDFLSWKYGVLILVSAGNIPDPIPLDSISSWSEFEKAAPSVRETMLLKALLLNRATRRLLAPSESMNALTVGACHSDAISPNGQGVMAVDPYETPELPNPSSALGLGYLRGVKPEIFFPGGREHVRSNRSHDPISVEPLVKPGRYFGIGAAAPDSRGDTGKKLNYSGTSVSTALATHSALKILEALEDIPPAPHHPTIDDDYQAVVAKTLLVHAAKWDENIASKLNKLSEEMGASHWEHQREDVARFLGYGVVNIERVLECTEKRATLIGWNTIRAKNSDQFSIPLPSQLENIQGFRSVTATVGWFTPLNANHRMYRMAKFEVKPGSDEKLSLDVENSKKQPSHHAFGKGTVFHRHWVGDKAAKFVDNGHMILNVSCKSVAGDLDDSIPYGLAVTIEVGEDVQVAVYEEIKERLRQSVVVKI